MIIKRCVPHLIFYIKSKNRKRFGKEKKEKGKRKR